MKPTIPAHQTDPQRLLNHAVAFREAAKRCGDGPLEINPGKEGYLAAPEVVCAAFCVEIYLKLLNRLSRGTYDTGHDLAEQYNDLPADVQRMADENHGWRLIEVLTDEARAFVQWRYVQEADFLASSPENLERVADALHRTVRQLRPDLLSVFERA